MVTVHWVPAETPGDPDAVKVSVAVDVPVPLAVTLNDNDEQPLVVMAPGVPNVNAGSVTLKMSVASRGAVRMRLNATDVAVDVNVFANVRSLAVIRGFEMREDVDIAVTAASK
jgi:hypothetical protein